VKRRKKQNHGKRSDERAVATIEAAGWKIISAREQGQGRYVACLPIPEEDESLTRLFESAFTLQDLAKQVNRRMVEEGR
jgi:hypothetical protein